jgi:mycothiol synthase
MPHGLPDGYSVRPPTPGDVEAVAAVLLADDLRDTGQPDFDADFVRQQWASSGFDPTVDAWVVEREGVVAAYAMVRPDGPERLTSWGVVHPDHRRLGIGSWLLDAIEARAAERLRDVPGATLQHAVTDTDLPAAEMARARGFALVRRFRHMQIDLHGPNDPGEAPAGIEIRGISPERDLPEIHEVFVEAFRGEWGYRVIPFAEWVAHEVDTPRFDPSLWLIATEDERAVGALSGLVMGDRGWVGELGVRPGWRRRGIASALLRRSFAIFAERGLPRVMLNVDAENPTGALRLYERVGMRAVRGWDLYEERLG